MTRDRYDEAKMISFDADTTTCNGVAKDRRTLGQRTAPDIEEQIPGI